jgi:acetyl esterase/lipase
VPRSVGRAARTRSGALLGALAVLAGLLAGLLAAALVRDSAPLLPAAASPPQAPSGDAVAPGVVRQTRSYGPGGLEHSYDVYLPAGEPVRPRPTVVFVHGGSWKIGDKVEWAPEAVQVVQQGWTAVSLNYRRTPTAPWPAPLDDVRAGLAHMQAAAGELGVDVTRTGAVGDSVGAQLAALLGRPSPGLVPVRAVVSYSGVFDLPGLLQQPLSGGCAVRPCAYRSLARRAVRDLMRCSLAVCSEAYRQASPAAGLTEGAATYAVTSETELIDPRQAWAMDAALSRARTASRVRVVRGGVHGRGYQSAVWADSLRFLEAALLPETAPPFPRPQVEVALRGPEGPVEAGTPVRLRGSVTPRATGSSVLLQVRGGDGRWRTGRTVPLRSTPDGTGFTTTVTVPAGTSAWRARWRGGGGEGVSDVTRVVAR